MCPLDPPTPAQIRTPQLTLDLENLCNSLLKAIQHQPTKQTEECKSEAEGADKAIAKARAPLFNRLPAWEQGLYMSVHKQESMRLSAILLIGARQLE
jgi:hypothetical protein